MTKLPDRSLLDGTKSPETTTGEFRLSMGNLIEYLLDFLGEESSDKETARQKLGINLKELNEKISQKADEKSVETALSSKADITELSGVAFTGNYNDLIDKLEKSTTLEGYGIIADTIPTLISTRPVTSSGIKEYVDNKVATAIVSHGTQIFTTSGTFLVPERVTSVRVRLCGGGGGGGSGSIFGEGWGGSGGTSSFGSYVSATGGGGGSPDYAGCVGSGVDGTVNLYGKNETNRAVPTTDGVLGQYGISGAGKMGKAGGNGGYAEKIIPNLVGGMPIAVTVGGGGAGGGKGDWGSAGVCIVEW